MFADFNIFDFILSYLSFGTRAHLLIAALLPILVLQDIGSRLRLVFAFERWGGWDYATQRFLEAERTRLTRVQDNTYSYVAGFFVLGLIPLFQVFTLVRVLYQIYTYQTRAHAVNKACQWKTGEQS